HQRFRGPDTDIEATGDARGTTSGHRGGAGAGGSAAADAAAAAIARSRASGPSSGAVMGSAAAAGVTCTTHIACRPRHSHPISANPGAFAVTNPSAETSATLALLL